MFMTVYARSKARFGIVQVPGCESLASDDPIEVLDRVPKALGGRNVKTGLEQMGCIQSCHETFRKLRTFDNLRQMFERMAQAAPLAGRDLESDLASTSRQRGESRVQGRNNSG